MKEPESARDLLKILPINHLLISKLIGALLENNTLNIKPINQVRVALCTFVINVTIECGQHHFVNRAS